MLKLKKNSPGLQISTDKILAIIKKALSTGDTDFISSAFDALSSLSGESFNNSVKIIYLSSNSLTNLEIKVNAFSALLKQFVITYAKEVPNFKELLIGFPEITQIAREIIEHSIRTKKWIDTSSDALEHLVNILNSKRTRHLATEIIDCIFKCLHQNLQNNSLWSEDKYKPYQVMNEIRKVIENCGNNTYVTEKFIELINHAKNTSDCTVAISVFRFFDNINPDRIFCSKSLLQELCKLLSEYIESSGLKSTVDEMVQQNTDRCHYLPYWLNF